MISIMIVDDHPVVRDGLEVLLSSEKGFSIHATAKSGEDALSICRKKGAPDVMVSDIRMDGMSGLDLLQRMRKDFPTTRVLLLAGMPLQNEVNEARTHGAAGYLPKSAKRGTLASAIRAVAADDKVFMEEDCGLPAIALTVRENEVLRYMALGKTREEMAIIMGLSAETVKTHSRHVIEKLDASNSAGAVARAYELGMLRA